jgi:hypothetical protein
MASVNKIFAKGTIVAITAKAEIAGADASLLEYSWRKNGVIQSSVVTAGTAIFQSTTPKEVKSPVELLICSKPPV